MLLWNIYHGEILCSKTRTAEQLPPRTHVLPRLPRVHARDDEPQHIDGMPSLSAHFSASRPSVVAAPSSRFSVTALPESVLAHTWKIAAAASIVADVAHSHARAIRTL